MTCRTGPCAASAHFNPKKAERDLRRYQRRGPDVTTQLILEELRRWPLQGLHLLDVGGGIGVIAVELVTAGLASITFADASAGYLEAARRHLASRGASRAAQFFLGDFATTADSLPDADVVTLDRVGLLLPGCGGAAPGSGRAAWSCSPILATRGMYASPSCWKTLGIASDNTRFALSSIPRNTWLRSSRPPDLSAPPATPRSSGPSTSTAAPPESNLNHGTKTGPMPHPCGLARLRSSPEMFFLLTFHYNMIHLFL